jgi:hypothetical protein
MAWKPGYEVSPVPMSGWESIQRIARSSPYLLIKCENGPRLTEHSPPKVVIRADRVAAPSDIEGKLRRQRANAPGTGALPLPHQAQVRGSADRIYIVHID